MTRQGRVARPGGHSNVIGALGDAKVAITRQTLFQRVRRKRGFQPVSTRAVQPEAWIVLQVRFGNCDLCAFSNIHHGGQCRQKFWSDFTQALGQVLTFVVRKEAVFLRVIGEKVRREIKSRLLAVDFHFFLRQRDFEAVRRPFVVGAKHNRVSTVQVEPQFIVVIANLREFLTHHRFHDLVVRSLLDINYSGLHAEFLMFHVERDRAILENRTPLQDDVISNLPCGSDSDFNSPIRERKS